jgi:hypothetical protein
LWGTEPDAHHDITYGILFFLGAVVILFVAYIVRWTWDKLGGENTSTENRIED